MADSRRHAVGWLGWWRLALTIAASVSVLAGITSAAVIVRLARMVVVPQTTRPEDVLILGVDRRAGTITLREHADAMLPGRYSLYFDGERGYARLGEIVGLGERTVTRTLIAEVRGRVTPGGAARLSAWYYESPTDFGYPFREVGVLTANGPASAWLVPAETDVHDWAILVHGRGVDRRETLRAVPAMRAEGFNSLLVSYRNDSVAPNSVDKRSALGDTEWSDIEAAIAYAANHGARRVVLMGWSMGGALVLQTVTRSPHASHVVGIILDSPVIDWVRVLQHQAGLLRVPSAIVRGAFGVIGRSWARWITGQAQTIDLRRLDFVARAQELRLPVLLMHSDSDTYVLAEGSRILAELRPDIVTYEQFSGAGHTRLWNYDSERWNTAIARWLNSRGTDAAKPSSP